MGLCRDRVFYVATEFGKDQRVSCRDKVGQARPGVFYHNRMYLCHDRVWPNGEVLCCDRAIPYCDIVGQAGKNFCRDRGFLGRDGVGKGKEILCRNRVILCHDRVGQGGENFCHDRGFLGHDRAGHDRMLCRT